MMPISEQLYLCLNNKISPNNILSKKNFYKIVDAGFKRVFTAFSNWPNERPLRYCYLDHFVRSSYLVLKKQKGRKEIQVPTLKYLLGIILVYKSIEF